MDTDLAGLLTGSLAIRTTKLNSVFVLLVPLALQESMPLARFAVPLGMERSALARTLKPLEYRKLVTVVVGEDRRTRIVILTEAGRQKLEQAFPLWEQAQLLRDITSQDLYGLTEGLKAAVQAIKRKR